MLKYRPFSQAKTSVKFPGLSLLLFVDTIQEHILLFLKLHYFKSETKPKQCVLQHVEE